jgi:hypothetical protein
MHTPHRQPALRRRVSPRRCALAAGVVILGLTGCLSEDRSEFQGTVAKHRAGQSSATGADERLFARSSFWNAPLSPDEELDSRSGALVGELVAQVREEIAARHGPWIGTNKSSTPIYRVPPDQPLVEVKLDSQIPHGPYEAFEAVPLPPDARPAAGADRHLTVWQPSTDRLWEFFGLERRPDGWHARWGGAIRSVSNSPGYYTSSSWPGARFYWGATATSLPVAGGVITVDELRRGRIDHALALNIKRVRAGVFSWPAQRSDGRTPGEDQIPEGARFRLDPQLDIGALGLHPVTQAIALAAQRHGMVVRDKSTTVALYAEDPSPFGHDPYPDLLAPYYPGQVNRFLDEFPWEHLQLLKLRLCPERTPAQLRRARDYATGECTPSGEIAGG